MQPPDAAQQVGPGNAFASAFGPSTLERIARDDLEGGEVVLAHIVAALRAAGAR